MGFRGLAFRGVEFRNLEFVSQIALGDLPTLEAQGLEVSEGLAVF